MLIADTAAVFATLLAFVTLIPQVRKLWRTRNADGVSTTWAVLGAVSNAAWTVYLTSQALWLALPSTASMVVFYLLTIGLIGWTGRRLGRGLVIGAGWATLLILATVAGGWPVLGLVLGVSFGVQAAPSLWTAFRTWAPSGISPGTWQLTLIEGLFWLVYGVGYRDAAIVMFGVLSSITAALIVARYYLTRHRWLDRAEAPSLRSPT